MDSNAGWHYYGLYVGITATAAGRFDGWVVRNNTFENDARRPAVRGHGLALGGQRRHLGLRRRRGLPPERRASAAARPTRPSHRRDRPRPQTAAFGWVEPGARRLPADARARRRSTPRIPSDAPARDRAGLVRDAKPDAGAHEFGASPPSSGQRRRRAPAAAPPRVAARPVVLTARVNRHKICKRARRGCPRRAVLRLTTSVDSKVQIRFLRKRHARSPKLVRKRTVRVRATKRVVIMAHKLRVGRYRVAALAREGSNRVSARQGIKLRVRR